MTSQDAYRSGKKEEKSERKVRKLNSNKSSPRAEKPFALSSRSTHKGKRQESPSPFGTNDVKRSNQDYRADSPAVSSVFQGMEKRHEFDHSRFKQNSKSDAKSNKPQDARSSIPK